MMLENRSVELRFDDSGGGVVEGIAVPYNNTINVGTFSERFERGAVDDISDTKLFYNHNEIIGRVTEFEDREEGLWIKAHISDTQKGNEVRQLLKDQALDKFSVGFLPLESRDEEGVKVREKVALREVSVVPFPAYNDANVLAVRQDEQIIEKEDENMSEENKDAQELVELRESVESLERKVDNIEIPALAPVEEKPMFRSYGEYIKARVQGTEEAVDFFKRYTVEGGDEGGVVADAISKDQWIGSVVDIFTRQRKVLNAFDTQALPPTGMNVEYAVLDTNTVQYEQQALEGDLLDFGKVSLDTALAPVKTYGGYTTLSRQEIERSNMVNILDTHFQAMNAAYAEKTNDEVRATVAASTDTQSLDNGAAGLDDTASVIGIVVDSAQLLDDVNRSIDSIIVSPGVFKELATIVDGNNRPVLEFRQPSVNTIGTASATALSATLLGVPVIVDPGAAEPTFWVVNSSALLTLESPGVPFRLSDSDITHLTNDFSVYGYMAIALQRPDYIVKVTNL